MPFPPIQEEWRSCGQQVMDLPKGNCNCNCNYLLLSKTDHLAKLPLKLLLSVNLPLLPKTSGLSPFQGKVVSEGSTRDASKPRVRYYILLCFHPSFNFLILQLQTILIILSYLILLQAVAVKQLDRNGLQGNREFLVEVLMLSLLHSPNLVSLIGYCADGDQRLLVYEFMPLGSLEDHLHGIQLIFSMLLLSNVYDYS